MCYYFTCFRRPVSGISGRAGLNYHYFSPPPRPRATDDHRPRGAAARRVRFKGVLNWSSTTLSYGRWFDQDGLLVKFIRQTCTSAPAVNPRQALPMIRVVRIAVCLCHRFVTLSEIGTARVPRPSPIRIRDDETARRSYTSYCTKRLAASMVLRSISRVQRFKCDFFLLELRLYTGFINGAVYKI